MMSGNARETYVRPALPHFIMDCRGKPGNDGKEARLHDAPATASALAASNAFESTLR